MRKKKLYDFKSFNESHGQGENTMDRIKSILDDKGIQYEEVKGGRSTNGTDLRQLSGNRVVGLISYHDVDHGENRFYRNGENERVIEVSQVEEIDGELDLDNMRLIEVGEDYSFDEREFIDAIEENL